MQQQVIITDYALCKPHKQTVRYYCEKKHCQSVLACGDCLFDVHKEHIKEVRQIKNLLENVNNNYKIYIEKVGVNENNQQNDQLEAINYKIYEIVKSKKINVIDKIINEQIEMFFKQFQIDLNARTNFFKNPHSQIQNLNCQFQSKLIRDIQFFEEKFLQLKTLDERLKQLLKKDNQLNLDSVDIDKLNNEIEKEVNNYLKKQQENIEHLLDNINKRVNSCLPIQKVQILQITWNMNKKGSIPDNNIENGKVSSPGGCDQQRFILSNESMPNGPVYMEIMKHETNGCYDSLGLCSQRDNYVRNGENGDGWAVRLYGDHSDLSFNGKVHNGQREGFYHQWKAEGERLGMLFNPYTKTLSYFSDGRFIGTAFTNVESTQPLFLCLEICHKGAYSLVQDVKLPDDDQIIDLI